MDTAKANNNENVNILEKAKNNKKPIIITCIAVIAVVAIGLIWYVLNQNASKKADEAIALADVEMNDSIALKYYMDAAELGHKSGNRAKLEVAIKLYNKGEYEKAIEYLQKASVNSDIVEAGKYSLLGDCYANLKKYDDAISSYNKAISVADKNPQIVPFLLVKEANVYRAQGNYEAEYKAYETVYNEYPGYTENLRFDIRKYAERAKAAASNK